MEIYREAAIFVAIFLAAILILLVYTQLFTVKKQITLVNSGGERINLNVEVADDPVKRARGLMFRQSLADDEGMLFVFDTPGKYGFWMVNTTIPLDGIYLDENGTVADIIAMDPCRMAKCPVYYPEKEAKYVLEVNQGFAVSNKIEKGKSRMLLE